MNKLEKLNKNLVHYKVEKYDNGYLLLEGDRTIIYRKTLKSIINELYKNGIINSRDI